MSTLEIKSRDKKTDITVDYEFPKDLHEAITNYGEEFVFSRFDRSFNAEIRAVALSAARKETNKLQQQATAVTALANYTPSVNDKAARIAKKIRKALEGEDKAVVNEALSSVFGDNSGDGADIHIAPLNPNTVSEAVNIS